jgi:hypothetical protein
MLIPSGQLRSGGLSCLLLQGGERRLTDQFPSNIATDATLVSGGSSTEILCTEVNNK